MWELDGEESWALKNWCFWTVVLEQTLESPMDCKEISPGCSLDVLMLKLKFHTLATWFEELIHWKRPWCWERLGAGGEGDDRGWDGWMASPTWWTWVWVNSRSWWWAGRPGVLRFMASQRVRHDWVPELTEDFRTRADWAEPGLGPFSRQWRAWACAGLPWPARCVSHPLPLLLICLCRLKRGGLDVIYQALRNPLPRSSQPTCTSISAWCSLFVPYSDFSIWPEHQPKDTLGMGGQPWRENGPPPSRPAPWGQEGRLRNRAGFMQGTLPLSPRPHRKRLRTVCGWGTRAPSSGGFLKPLLQLGGDSWELGSQGTLAEERLAWLSLCLSGRGPRME